LHLAFGQTCTRFMLILASARVGNGPTGRATVQDAQRDTAAYEFLSEEERRAWTAAIEFYMDSLARVPAWNEPALLNEALWRANSADELPADDVPSTVHRTLTEAAVVYRRHWWKDHARENTLWLAEQRGYIEEHGPAIADRLSRAFGAQWPPHIPVIITAHASWAGAFQTDTPLLVHISSRYEAHRGTGVLEQLYHEVGHAIDDSVFQALRREAERQSKTAPRGFWQELTHLILFYTTGYAVRERIPEHVPYAER
jgi:hypothetical protein